jgi:hypothetical protein
MTMENFSNHQRSQAGMTLIETVLALAILFTITAGLMAMSAVAIITTENQGHLAARTAEYSQDKMEQLLSLGFADEDTDTISADCVLYLVNPDCSVGAAGLAIGGSLNLAAPVDNYVDYLDRDGNPLGGGGGGAVPADWFYMRVWRIEAVSATLKRITVACTTRSAIGGNNTLAPVATLVSLKAEGF